MGNMTKGVGMGGPGSHGEVFGQKHIRGTTVKKVGARKAKIHIRGDHSKKKFGPPMTNVLLRP